ncbi:hypothetical protein E1267_42815 [Nonomuraea longispora]|uniref:Uncharacterized protein n=1 Tax=Nonomuraea longispora TaxID=1848320 RepID=A0A4R4MJS3_9ACTN|nr:hypothetical protein [Nonomuraea longispora]TDB94372.1 hypothetical protein E1267_42815 [Nonomuraea longispora]
MNMKSLSELQTPDERTLRFTPYGLGIDRALTPEAAAEYQQTIMASHTLSPDVSDGTRRSFDMLRDLYVLGIFRYEVFSAVHDRALFVIEQALRDRFVAFHNGTVTFVDASHARHVVPPAAMSKLSKRPVGTAAAAAGQPRTATYPV